MHTVIGERHKNRPSSEVMHILGDMDNLYL